MTSPAVWLTRSSRGRSLRPRANAWLIGLALILGACAPERLDVQRDERLLVWGFDKVFLGELRDSGLALNSGLLTQPRCECEFAGPPGRNA